MSSRGPLGGATVVLTEHLVRLFWSRVNPVPGCWEWAGAKRNGYGVCRGISAHRVSWVIANGQIPSGMLVRHSCDNPPCVNPAHLELGTPLQNTADMIARGRSGCAGDRHYSKHRPDLVIRGDRHYLRRNPDRVLGSANPFAKLNEVAVAEIKALGRGGMGPREIAAKFGVSSDNVRLILLGKAWRHVR